MQIFKMRNLLTWVLLIAGVFFQKLAFRRGKHYVSFILHPDDIIVYYGYY